MEAVKYIFPITPQFNGGHKKRIKLKYVGLHSLTKSNFHPLQNIKSCCIQTYCLKTLRHIGSRFTSLSSVRHQLDIFLSILFILIKYFASPLREISLHSEIEFMLIKTAINQIVIILPNISTCELGKIFSLIQSVLIFRVSSQFYDFYGILCRKCLVKNENISFY